jgi:hypothetical protein
MSRDLRKYARKTNVRLLAGFGLVLLLVGVGLIYLIYGSGPALMGLLCILAGLLPVILIIFAFGIMEAIVERGREH